MSSKEPLNLYAAWMWPYRSSGVLLARVSILPFKDTSVLECVNDGIMGNYLNKNRMSLDMVNPILDRRLHLLKHLITPLLKDVKENSLANACVTLATQPRFLNGALRCGVIATPEHLLNARKQQ